MKKICLVFSLLIFLLSFVPFSGAFAQTGSITEKKPGVNYELPYPGLLPDSPLYFLRVIRDKTVGFLISDPLKKSEFDLLQADKRLNAGIYLFNRGKVSLALSTISKAENYFEAAIQKVKEARKEGMETRETINKLINSSSKHQEILRSLEKKVPQNFRAGVDFQLQRAVSFEKEVISLTLK